MRKGAKRRSTWSPSVAVGVFTKHTAPQTPMSDKAVNAFSLDAWASYHAICRGEGKDDHWHTLGMVVAWSEAMCDAGYGAEGKPSLIAAADALMRANERHSRTGKWGFDGPAIATIKEAIELFDAQLQAGTVSDLMQCLLEAKRRRLSLGDQHDTR